MERFTYQGIRPHVESASESAGADPSRVMRLDAVRKVADLLCQAVTHRNSESPEHAPGSLEACRPCLAELEAALVACRAAFDEVSAACGPPEDVSQIGKPEDEHAPHDAEGEGLGVNDDAPPTPPDDGPPGEVIGRSDNDEPIVLGEDPVTVPIGLDDPGALQDVLDHLPPEDEPPAHGKKSRRR